MNALIMALDSIREKKGRSFLTMLGIINGVAAVLVLVALVSGYNADVTAYYEKLGVNKVTVSLTWYDSTRAVDLTDALYEYVNGDLAGMAEGVTPAVSTGMSARRGSVTVDSTTVYLGNEQFDVCSNYTLDRGRGILSYDVENRGLVCVIGAYLADTLFQYADPIGETILLNGNPFTVVGTYYQKDGSEEDSMDNAVLVPYSLNRKLLTNGSIASYTVKVGKSDDMDAVMDALELWLTGQISDSVGAFTLTDGNAAMTASNDEMTSMSVVLGGIAGIALLVGGIGIMNIMLVTVTERTREIGIKKSIGAPRREIVAQFLIEAAILSGLGGLIGIGLGFALSAILGKAMYGLILFPNTLITVGAFAFSVVIGIVFGIYPAVKASNLQPVDALRAE